MKEITVTELKRKLDAGETIHLIDVREPYENEEYNIGGLLIPLADITSQIEKLKSLGEGDIVFYCRSGNRSTMAQKLVKPFGIENTLSLRGGMNEWQEKL